MNLNKKFYFWVIIECIWAFYINLVNDKIVVTIPIAIFNTLTLYSILGMICLNYVKIRRLRIKLQIEKKEDKKNE